MIEVEIRGKLIKAEFEKLFALLRRKGELKDHYHRLSIDISPGFDEKTRKWSNTTQVDLRIKKSDDKEKISAKIGSYDQKGRGEVEVKLASGELPNALDLFEALGFRSGMIYYWESWEFDYKDFEIKLSKHSEDYYTFEIESSKADPNLLAEELNLKAFNKEEYREAIDWENRNIHRLYKKETVQELIQLMF